MICSGCGTLRILLLGWGQSSKGVRTQGVNGVLVDITPYV